MNFIGTSLALSPEGLASVAERLLSGAAEVSAIVSVETHGSGFLPDRRPQILFERHIFSRLTQGRYDGTHPNISSPIPGGYQQGGAFQYVRLAQAMELDNDAALQSTSWGIAQVMGMNFQAAGFDCVQDMVNAMVTSEDAQLAAMGLFIASKNLAHFIAVHDWVSFARAYNGPGYAQNRYDVELNGYYQKYLTGAAPDLTVRAAQLYLEFRGFDPHGVDGILGPATQSALKAFQTSIGASSTGTLDDTTMRSLMPVYSES